MKNKLIISILLAIIVGTPLLAIYKPGIGLIVGGILLGMLFVYLIFQPNGDDDYEAWVDGYRYDYSYNPNPKHKD